MTRPRASSATSLHAWSHLARNKKQRVTLDGVGMYWWYQHDSPLLCAPMRPSRFGTNVNNSRRCGAGCQNNTHSKENKNTGVALDNPVPGPALPGEREGVPKTHRLHLILAQQRVRRQRCSSTGVKPLASHFHYPFCLRPLLNGTGARKECFVSPALVPDRCRVMGVCDASVAAA